MKQRIAQRRLPLRPALAPWPPEWAALPDLEELERLSRPSTGQRQRELFPEPPAVARDDSRDGRLARLLGEGGQNHRWPPDGEPRPPARFLAA
ncbi:MAG: hypothetical protein L6306_17315, partial [Planctomycetales bacterium]|nr:hypothetical protein [Planctomycetales bacterium]